MSLGSNLGFSGFKIIVFICEALSFIFILHCKQYLYFKFKKMLLLLQKWPHDNYEGFFSRQRSQVVDGE